MGACPYCICPTVLGLNDIDDAAFANAVPRQADHQRLELLVGQLNVDLASTRPHESALIEAPCGQPNAQTIMHQNLHTVGALVGKYIGVVRASRAEVLHHTGQRRVGASAHIHGLDCQPDLIHADHVNSAFINCAKLTCPSPCHCNLAVTPLCPVNSSVMPCARALAALVGSGTETLRYAS